MLDYKTTLRHLCGIMSVSGCEREAARDVISQYGKYFDSAAVDRARNIILMKKSQKPNAPKIMLDAHIDQIGMMVTGITSEGLLTVTNIGGIDRVILPACEVVVHGKEKLYGVVAATPPHLQKPGDTAAPEWTDIRIDIGYTKEEAEKLVPLGTPVCWYYTGDELMNGRMTGVAFDDKACAAGLLCAVVNTPSEKLAYDVFLTLSSGEEIGGGGARNAAFEIKPDLAVVTDVNFAFTPGVDEDESGKLGEGIMISLSAVTDRPLTKKIIALAAEKEIPVTTVVEPTSTGTNASCLVYSENGVPAAVVSLPLAGMHSYNELLDMSDAENFVKLFREIISHKM